MSTGDMKNNLKKLQKEANLMHYPEDLDYEGLTKGEPEAHLAILYHAFFEYSDNIHKYLTKLGYNISGKRGNPFIAVVFKVIRERDPTLKLTLKVSQFMSKGFAERKIILTTAILNYVRINLKTSCSSRVVSQPKRDVKAENKCKAHEWMIPDMSCIKHDHGVPMNFHQDEVPATEMQSTAVNPIRQKNIHGPHSVTPIKTSQENRAFEQDVNCTSGMQKECLTSNTKIEHGAMLESLPLVSKVENCILSTQHEDNQNMTCTTSLHSKIDELFTRVSSLELKNQQMSLQLEEQISINEDLRKNNEVLKQIVETYHSKFDDIKVAICKEQELTERVKGLESAINQFKDSVFGKRMNSHYSPVCGNNVCKQFDNLRLDSRTPDDNSTVFFKNSLSDITNESPLNPTHSRSEKLFELVRGTRSLLGMDVTTPKASKSNLENDVFNHSDDATE